LKDEEVPSKDKPFVALARVVLKNHGYLVGTGGNS
jgi:hypothetical protein